MRAGPAAVSLSEERSPRSSPSSRISTSRQAPSPIPSAAYMQAGAALVKNTGLVPGGILDPLFAP